MSTRQQEMLALVENSVFLAAELRVRQVFQIVRGWTRNKTFHRVLLAFFLFRAWNFLRQRRMPQFFAQLLIRWLAAVSSLDGPPTPSRLRN